MFHAHLKPHPPKDSLNKDISPTTMIMTIYFPADFSTADRENFEEGWNKLIAAAKNETGSCTGHAAGWIVEKLQVPGSEEKSVAYAACIGMDTAQARSIQEEPQWFKDLIRFVENAKGFRKLEVCHASLVMIGK